jgi:hypothetical protein
MLWQPTVAHFAGGKYGHIVTAQVNLGLTDTSLEHHAFYCFNLAGADSVRSPEIEQWPSKDTFSKEDLDLGMLLQGTLDNNVDTSNMKVLMIDKKLGIWLTTCASIEFSLV